MAKTLKEVLLQSGLTQEQIDAIDAKALAAGDTYITTVEKTASEKEKSASDLAVKAEADRKAQEEAVVAAKSAQEAAELQQRSVKEFWENTYNPGVAAWEAEKAKLAKAASDAAAEAAFYKAQHASLKDLGIVPADAPVFTPSSVTPPATETVKTPGTPTFTDEQINQRIGSGLSNSVWALQEHQRLTGNFLPDPIDQLAQEATQQKLPFRDYVARKYDFAGKQRAAQEAAARKHDEEVAAAERVKIEAEWKPKLEAQASEFAAKERKMAEQMSANPDVRLPQGSAQFTELRRATSAGERPDPTKMTPEARIKLTQENLRHRLEERQQQVA